MLVANFADLHFRGSDLDAVHRQLETAVTICIARGVELITIAGDLLDKSSIEDMQASAGAIAEALIQPLAHFTTAPGAPISRLALPSPPSILIIPGDHDYTPGRRDALTILDPIPGVQVVRSPQWVQFPQGLSVFCLPWDWFGTMEHATQILARAFDTPPPVPRSAFPTPHSMLLAHLEVIDLKMSGMKIREASHGTDKRAWCVTRELLASLPFTRFALGNYHTRQEIDSPSSPLAHDSSFILHPARGGMVGAIRQLNRGESGNPQGFEIWDAQTNVAEWIELDCCPRHRTIDLAPGEPIPPAAPNEKLHVRCAGWLPSKSDVLAAEALGTVKVHHIPAEQTRVARAAPPDGLLKDPRKIMSFWAGNQEPKLEPPRLSRMIDTYENIFADSSSHEPQALGPDSPSPSPSPSSPPSPTPPSSSESHPSHELADLPF